MFKYRLEVTKQKFVTVAPPPPPKFGFLSYVLIPISKKHFRENPIFLQINKGLLILNPRTVI